MDHKVFIEQYNGAVVKKTLQKVMEFPGVSMERSLNCFLEEYPFDRGTEVLFAEAKKVNSYWLFRLDPKDSQQYDTGVYLQKKELYHCPDNNVFNDYWKYRNSKTCDYWVTQQLEGDLFAPFRKEIASSSTLTDQSSSGQPKK